MATIAINVEELDPVLIAHAEWHAHAAHVRLAYAAWLTAETGDRACRFAAYLEELDREQRAAELYAMLVDRRRRIAPAILRAA
jgi:hypothetical protein